MTFEAFPLGWREALVGVVILLALYVLVVFLRLRRLRRPATWPKTSAPDGESAAAPAPAAESAAEPSTEPAASAAPKASAAAPDRRRQAAAYVSGPAAAAFPWNEAPDALAPEARIAALEGELNRLRNEQAMLRGDLSGINGAISQLHAQFQHELTRISEHMQAMQHVTPIYGDAMQMALAGHGAAVIAEHCGIARAEADLVVALIRSQNQPAEALSQGDREP